MPPIPQSPLLFLFADVEVVFQNLNSRADQHVLQRQDVLHEALILAFCAELHHSFHARPIVPASIKENQFLRGGQMRHIALKVPGGVVPVSRSAKSDNAGFPRAEVFDDPLDRSVFSGRITSFEDDQHFVAMLYNVFLNFDELDLEVAQRLLVASGPVLPTVCLRGLCHLGSRLPY